jgi:hypothetical protein
MSEPSTCVGCFYAEWSRTTGGRLHPTGEGMCRYFKFHPLDLKLPEAFFWLSESGPRPLGGQINRRASDGLSLPCSFKSKEAKP